MTGPQTEPLTAEGFQSATGVSHETLVRLADYVALLTRWQARINLVGGKTLSDPWRRHLLDSAQVLGRLPESTQKLADLGSGAGFPGLVLAIMGVQEVHLIESDSRKCAFLREAARVTATPVHIHDQRVERLGELAVDVVTARGLAPVTELLRMGAPLVRESGCWVLLKGRHVDDELTLATKYWTMATERWPSRSDDDGVVLRLSDVRPKTQER